MSRKRAVVEDEEMANEEEEEEVVKKPRKRKHTIDEDEEGEEEVATQSAKKRKKKNDSDEDAPDPSQSTRKKKKKKGDDDDSDAGPTQTQGGTQSMKNVSSEELTKLTNDLVRYILFRDSVKLPIVKGDIKKNICPNHSQHNLVKHIWDKANDVLKNIFGYELVEVPRKEDTEQKKSQKSSTDPSNVFILRNRLLKTEPKSRELMTWDNEEQRGLLMTILSLIDMSSGKKIAHKKLAEHLLSLGVDIEPKSASKRAKDDKDDNDAESKNSGLHAVLGDVKSLVTKDWVNQLYLQRDRTTADEGGPDFEYRWGPRAKMEIEERLDGARRNTVIFEYTMTGEKMDSVTAVEIQQPDAEAANEE